MRSVSIESIPRGHVPFPAVLFFLLLSRIPLVAAEPGLHVQFEQLDEFGGRRVFEHWAVDPYERTALPEGELRVLDRKRGEVRTWRPGRAFYRRESLAEHAARLEALHAAEVGEHGQTYVEPPERREGTVRLAVPQRTRLFGMLNCVAAELLDAAKKPVLGAWVLRDAVLASTLAADIKKRLRLPPSLRYRYERADVLLFLAAGVVPIALDLPVAPFVLQRLELHDLAGAFFEVPKGTTAVEGGEYYRRVSEDLLERALPSGRPEVTR
ncbi:MAG: hypothetical protein A2284_09810 [Deltaproteobacteria bacterium RIFOXYA12_FULL_61_11]|nr:MAG: hypothetical protein A2284_09810 [Deltaproteobacteria bacterium RIFOXYA12_FULL_61_11]